MKFETKVQYNNWVDMILEQGLCVPADTLETVNNVAKFDAEAARMVQKNNDAYMELVEYLKMRVGYKK